MKLSLHYKLSLKFTFFFYRSGHLSEELFQMKTNSNFSSGTMTTLPTNERKGTFLHSSENHSHRITNCRLTISSGLQTFFDAYFLWKKTFYLGNHLQLSIFLIDHVAAVPMDPFGLAKSSIGLNFSLLNVSGRK